MENNMKIRGVNLGNWLVLEKWMSPALFEGTKAEDEDALCRELPRQELIERLTAHRGSYITREDFIYISERGLNMVRIPVPHFIFGDDPVYCEPYVPCIEYLDRAFDWAGETGLQILIDLHTAPESQNGFDNGGICGVCKWAQSPERIDRVLKVLGMLAERYKSHPALWGIQLLNEPISEPLWQMIRSRYLPQDPERAAGSSFVPLEVLYDFTPEAIICCEVSCLQTRKSCSTMVSGLRYGILFSGKQVLKMWCLMRTGIWAWDSPMKIRMSFPI